MSDAVLKRVVYPALRFFCCAILPLAAAQAEDGGLDPYLSADYGELDPYLSGSAFYTARDLAGPEAPSLLPDTEVFRFETRDNFYDKRRYSDDFRMKGIEISPNVFFGEARIAGEKGPGIVVEQDGWFWGFNHQGAEILLKF